MKTEHTPEKAKSPVVLNDILGNNPSVKGRTSDFYIEQHITGIELFNSIYNLWLNYFDTTPSFTALTEKKIEEFAKFQSKLFADGFEKIFTSLSVDSRSIYYVHREHQQLMYVNIGSGIDLDEKNAVVSPTYGNKYVFSCSICASICEDNAEYLERFISYYGSLESPTKMADDSIFYMIAQTAQGLTTVA